MADPVTKSPPAARAALLTLAFVALVLPVCYSLLTPYVPDGHDTLEYLTRQVEFDRNIRAGIWFPQWAPDLAHGAGEPLFEFNPPIIYYLAEFWRLLGTNFIVAINLACVLLVIASAFGMFLLGRLYFGSRGGWLAAAAFLYAPYFAVNLYVRGALAEFAAFPFFAFALYGFGAYAKRKKLGYLLVGASAYAGVLLSHNGSALFFTPPLLAFFVLTAYREWRVLMNDVLGWLLGLGVGACVWLPSLADRKYVLIERVLEGYSRYSNHYVYWHQFVSKVWGYGKSVPGDQDMLSFSLGWTHLVLVLLAFALALKFRKVASWGWLWFFTAMTAFLCFLMTSASAGIWDRVPLLQYVAFPWRLLGPACFCVALLVASLAPAMEQLRWKNTVFVAALALLIVPNFRHNRPFQYRAENMAQWTPTRISERGIEATTLFEYVPRTVKAWPAYNPRGFWVESGDGDVRVTTRGVASWAGEVHASQPTTIDLAVTWYPGWTVLVDGARAQAGPADPTGLVRVTIPPGTHHVEAALKRTWPRWLGQAISCVALLTMSLLGAISLRRH
jgi:Dolichyl-phosphate-mannose-protein mannosyltransferase